MQTGCLIHLDNDYLTNLPGGASTQHTNVRGWTLKEHPIGTSAVAWTEFMRGPNNNGRNKTEISVVKMLLTAGIVPFGEEEAELAAYLFNVIQRPKGFHSKLRMDSLIAACAITKNALLATDNMNHFKCFIPYRLECVDLGY
jgi:predicted nucleic acid-binding protein